MKLIKYISNNAFNYRESNRSALISIVFLHIAVIVNLFYIGFEFGKSFSKSLAPPQVYGRDFLQDYLSAQALKDGTNPYLSIQGLANHYLGSLPRPVFPHSNPHPPPVLFLFLLFGNINYIPAIIVWLCFEILCLSGSLWFLMRSIGYSPSKKLIIAATVALLVWYPIIEELWFGQLGLLLLFLLSAVRYASLSKREFLTGLLLGCALLVKPIIWPLFCFFAIKKRFRAVSASLLVLIVGYGISAYVMGIKTIIEYYTHVLPSVTSMYKSLSANLSLSSLGYRIFDGTNSGIMSGINSFPLIESKPAALIAAGVFPLIILLFALFIMRKQNNFDLSFGFMICISILVSPISWIHYFVLMLIPVTAIIHWIRQNGSKKREFLAVILTCIMLFIPYPLWFYIPFLLSGRTFEMNSAVPLSFTATLVTFFPLVPLYMLVILTSKLAAKHQQVSTYSDLVS